MGDRQADDEWRRALPVAKRPPGERLIGWTGRAEAASGHTALVLTAMVQQQDGSIRAGSAIPLTLRWDEQSGRFRSYMCRLVDDQQTVCEVARDGD